MNRKRMVPLIMPAATSTAPAFPVLLGVIALAGASGLAADLLGWCAVFVAASALMLVLAAILVHRLSQLEARRPQPYGPLLLSDLQTATGDRADPRNAQSFTR